MPPREPDADEKAARLQRALKFTGCVVRAYFRGNSIKTNTHGDWEVTLVIPRSRAEDVLAISQAVGVPVVIGIRPWRRGEDDITIDTPMDAWATEDVEVV